MCILCVVQRWSRRVATMLPWLVIPLIAMWVFSQLLPPPFRFEITSPRLACVTVLLITLFWYEILMPQLSVWRARRSARLRERRRAQAIELQKLRKTATRRCRNCFTPYRDQNPGGGRFMCSYCGHISKRPVLDLPGGDPPSSGINGWICGQDWVGEGGGSWPGSVPRYWSGNGGGGDRCMTEKSYSGALLFACKLMSCFFVGLRWIFRKVFRVGSSEDVSDGDNKNSSRKGENGGSSQESRGEKARRKAEEKRQARLEKEMLEEEERKQREEVTRLVEERRKLRDEILEAERIHSKGYGHDGDRERRKEAERKKQEKKKEKDKGSSKSNSDVEEFDRRTSRENERKREADKKSEPERRDSNRTVVEKYNMQTSEPGNGTKVATSKPKYFDRMKGSFLSSSKGFNGAYFFGRNAQTVPAPTAKANKPAGFIDQTQSATIRKDAQFGFPGAGKINPSADDRAMKPGCDKSVGSEVRPPVPAPKKSWHHLFTRSSAVSPCDDMNATSDTNQNSKLEGQSAHMTEQRMPSSHSLDNQVSFMQTSPFNAYPLMNCSTGGSLFPHALPDASLVKGQGQNPALEEAEIFEDPCYVPDPISLLGPVSDSLDNFPLDLGAGFVACNKLEEPHTTKKISAPVDVSKPSPIESPMSRSRVSEEKYAPIGQPPSSPKSWDEASNPHEKRTWQPWDPPLAQDALGILAGSSSWFLPSGERKPSIEDMLHPRSHDSMVSQVAVGSCPLSGTFSQQNVHVGNYKTDQTFSPLGHGLNGNDIWMQKAHFQRSLIDGSINFHPFNLMDKAARNEVKYDGSNGSEAHDPFGSSPANCWSNKDWRLHGLQNGGNSIPAPDSVSLFSCGPDVQSVWASNQKDKI